MTQEKHTHSPAPWRSAYCGQPDIKDANGRVIASVEPLGETDEPTHPETEANADLIAAAPETAAERDRLREINKDLLEALTLRRMEDGYNASENKEELLAQIESRCRKHGYKGLESGDGIFLCEFIDTLCDAAIAKAGAK